MGTKLPLPISRDEFCEALVRLCVANRLLTWPKRDRDQQVLLKSIAMRLAEDDALDEALVNERITGWLETSARGAAVSTTLSCGARSSTTATSRAQPTDGAIGSSRDCCPSRAMSISSTSLPCSRKRVLN